MVAIKLDLATYFLNQDFKIFIEKHEPFNYIMLSSDKYKCRLVYVNGEKKDKLTTIIYEAILNEIYNRYLETFCVVDLVEILNKIKSQDQLIEGNYEINTGARP